MDTCELLMILLDSMLDTKKKRHLVGGILLSLSLFFGGLGITALTIKMEERK